MQSSVRFDGEAGDARFRSATVRSSNGSQPGWDLLVNLDVAVVQIVGQRGDHIVRAARRLSAPEAPARRANRRRVSKPRRAASPRYQHQACPVAAS